MRERDLEPILDLAVDHVSFVVGEDAVRNIILVGVGVFQSQLRAGVELRTHVAESMWEVPSEPKGTETFALFT